MTVKFTSEYQPKDRPPRGKSRKTLILNSIREKSLLGVDSGASKDEVEQAFFDHLVESAFVQSEDSQVTSICLQFLMDRGWKSHKSVMPKFEFELTAEKPHEKAYQVIDAIADGLIPPDVGSEIIKSISSAIKIEEVTELRERLDGIERSLGLDE